MMLTKEPIEKILDSGSATHSEFGQKFIALTENRLGLHITAAYHQSGTELDIAPNKNIEILIKKQQIHFVRSSILTVWCHSDEIGGRSETDMEAAIDTIFRELLCKESIEIEYPRTYVPQEMRYYGWTNRKKEDWDTSNMIPLNANISEIHTVHIEYIDHLALWRTMENSLNILNHCPCISNIRARVLCGYDQRRNHMAYYVILPPHIPNDFDRVRLCREFSQTALDILKPNNIWNALNVDAVSPIVCKWDELSEDMKFAFSKR